MISKIKPDDIGFIGLEIKVSELAALMDINLKYAYREIQKTTKKLMGRVIHIPEETGWLLTHWVSSCRYHHKKGTVSFKFDENLKPYLLQLREEFTKVHLDVVAQFQSIYTIRIYQLLKAFVGIGWREISIDELKEMLGLKLGQYAEYRDFNKRVITEAKKEMDAVDENGMNKSDLTFEVETIREGRKITCLKFIIIKNEQLKKKESKPFSQEKAKSYSMNSESEQLDNSPHEVTDIDLKETEELDRKVFNEFIEENKTAQQSHV
jgi:plasmid replication initiation protein